MKKYYTRACNFAYGKFSIELVRKKKNLPLNGNKKISFGQIEILTRTSIKKIDLKDIKKLPKLLKEKINKDLKTIVKKNKNFSSLNFNKIPNIMGILNLTPDSFSDGGKFNKKKTGISHAKNLFKSGADIVDVGGESTRPGSKPISKKEEWNRIKGILKNISRISKICSNYKIELLLESNMSPQTFMDLKEKICHKNCYFLFDTGNRIVLQRNFEKDIMLFGKDIKHIKVLLLLMEKASLQK